MTLLTIKNVAERLQISLSMAYALVQRGELPSYQIGSCRRVSEQDLNDFLGQTRAAEPVQPKRQRTHF